MSRNPRTFVGIICLGMEWIPEQKALLFSKGFFNENEEFVYVNRTSSFHLFVPLWLRIFQALRIIGPSKQEGFDPVLRRVLGSPNYQL